MTGPSNILQNERQLFMQMAAGDEAAFALIFYHYVRRLQPFVYSMTRSEEATEDIIQEVFLDIWARRVQMRDIDNYQAYIFTMSNNRVYAFLKQRARQYQSLEAVEDTRASATPGAEELLDYKASRELIEQAIEQLPPQKKLIFRLSRDGGLSHEEIARKLDLSKSTVNNHLTESIRLIKEYLREGNAGSLALIYMILKMYR